MNVYYWLCRTSAAVLRSSMTMLLQTVVIALHFLVVAVQKSFEVECIIHQDDNFGESAFTSDFCDLLRLLYAALAFEEGLGVGDQHRKSWVRAE